MRQSLQIKNLLDRLQYIITTSEYKAKESVKSQKEHVEISALLDKRKNEYAIVLKTMEYSKLKRKDLVEFSNEKKETALSEIYAGIYSAQDIIQEVGPTRLKVDKGSAILVNDKDLSVNAIEGSAYRALLSFNIRGIVLKNTEYMNTLFLDEPLATLSAETSALFSAKLDLLGRLLQIILVEQKAEVFSDTENLTYLFKKLEGETHVRRIVNT